MLLCGPWCRVVGASMCGSTTWLQMCAVFRSVFPCHLNTPGMGKPYNASIV